MGSSRLEQKRRRINKALDDCKAKLDAEGCKFFLTAIDRDKDDPEGGKVIVNSDINGEDFTHVLQVALPDRKDLINLGIWVGTALSETRKDQA